MSIAKRNWPETIANVAIAVAAVALASTLAVRVARGGGPDSPSSPIWVTEAAEWPQLVTGGRQVGNATSPIQIVEFVDLECSACRAFDAVLGRLQEAYSNELGLVIVHFPLDGHAHARDAAHASECAAAQGRFKQYVSTALSSPDSLRSHLWTEMAHASGVADLPLFEQCVSQSGDDELVLRGVQLALDTGIRFTPTVFINGWRFSTTPTERELKLVIDALRSGSEMPLTIR